MVKLQVWLLSAAVVLAAVASAYGQNLDAAPSPYFDCPYVNYFDRDCPQLWEEQERRRLRGRDDPAPVPPGQDAGRQVEQPEQDDGALHDLDTGETYLLFPKESLSPDAPPLFRLLLAAPTIENARRYVRWYARRTARMQAVQALIRLAGSELESETEAGGEGQR